MKREITTHCGSLLNDSITIHAIGKKTPGGANRFYEFRRPGFETGDPELMIQFQDGNPANFINGISNESLLAVVRDRLEGFQSGPFACERNATALTHLQAAMDCFKDRTAERKERGVEGTLQQ